MIPLRLSFRSLILNVLGCRISAFSEHRVYILLISGGHAVYFIINPSNGEIQAKNRLDRDASGAIITYNLDLTVTDAGGNTVTQALDVTLNDINDNAPVCSPPLYTTSLAENTAVGTLKNTDKDAVIAEC